MNSAPSRNRRKTHLLDWFRVKVELRCWPVWAAAFLLLQWLPVLVSFGDDWDGDGYDDDTGDWVGDDSYYDSSYYDDSSSMDSDYDGYSDQEEYDYGTDPSDSSSYPGSESYDSSYYDDPSSMDSDYDGYSDQEEYDYGTDPYDSSSYPGSESYDSSYYDDSSSIDPEMDSDPSSTDSDGDGLLDGDELTWGTDPMDQDTDDDQISDYDEVNGVEIHFEYEVTTYSETSGESFSQTYSYSERVYPDPTLADSDGDLIPDGAEYYMGFHPTGSSDGLRDDDGDDLSNGEEYQAGTGMTDPDSDDDGWNDGEEVLLMGTNPKDRDDPPPPPATEDPSGMAPSDENGATGGGDPAGDSGVGDAANDSEGAGDSMESPESGGSNGEPETGAAVPSGEDLRYAGDPNDADGDGLLDAWERLVGLDPSDPDDGASDADGDGLTAAQEFALHTHPQRADSDGDGLRDGDEVAGFARIGDYDWQMNADNGGTWESVSVYDPETGEYLGRESVYVESQPGPSVFRTDPARADTDGDGYSDRWELDNGLNPLDPADTCAFGSDSLPEAFRYWHENHFGISMDPWGDTDGDGLNDGEEFNYRTDPFYGDTDGDGISDGEEVWGIEIWVEDSYQETYTYEYYDEATGENFTEEYTNYNYGGYSYTVTLNPTNPDTDGDGYPDGYELAFGLDPTSPWDGRQDADGDGLGAGQEYLAGSNPGLPDSDYDGIGDRVEVLELSPLMEALGLPGFDPMDRADGLADYDADGLTNAAEVAAGTGILDADSDDDGFTDGVETGTLGTDPLDPADPGEGEDGTDARDGPAADDGGDMGDTPPSGDTGDTPGTDNGGETGGTAGTGEGGETGADPDSGEGDGTDTGTPTGEGNAGGTGGAISTGGSGGATDAGTSGGGESGGATDGGGNSENGSGSGDDTSTPVDGPANPGSAENQVTYQLESRSIRRSFNGEFDLEEVYYDGTQISDGYYDEETGAMHESEYTYDGGSFTESNFTGNYEARITTPSSTLQSLAEASLGGCLALVNAAAEIIPSNLPWERVYGAAQSAEFRAQIYHDDQGESYESGSGDAREVRLVALGPGGQMADVGSGVEKTFLKVTESKSTSNNAESDWVIEEIKPLSLLIPAGKNKSVEDGAAPIVENILNPLAVSGTETRVRLLPVDLDIIKPGTKDQEEPEEISEELEDTAGEAMEVNWDDDDYDAGPSRHGHVTLTNDFDDPDGVAEEDDLIQLILHSLDLKNTKFRLKFSEKKFRLYRNNDKTDPVVSESTEFDPTTDTNVYVEGIKISDSEEGEKLTLQLQINGGEWLQGDTVTLHIARTIVFIEGNGSTGLHAMESYTESAKKDDRSSFSPDRFTKAILIKGKNEAGDARYYAIRLAFHESQMKLLLGTPDIDIVFDGHSNYGIGPSFPAPFVSTFTSINDFMNVSGRGIASFDFLYYRDNVCSGLSLNTSDIAISPTNYSVRIPKMLRFPSSGTVAGESFSLKGTADKRHHYYFTAGSRNRVIVNSAGDVPTLKYRSLFMNSCFSGRDFSETFSNGVFLYTKSICASADTSSIFVKGIVEGKKWSEIVNDLNLSENVYGFHIF